MNIKTKISVQNYFERILSELDRQNELRDKMIEERFASLSKALELQATEYARRLHDLNGEYQRDRIRQNEYVTADKWETTNEAERVARAAALLRVDEKFEEYVKRYEVRQREVDLLLAAQAGAAEEAKRAVEEQGRKSNRNLGIASFALGLIVFLANIIPVIVK